MRVQQRRLQRRRGKRLQIAPTDLGIGVLGGNHFALLGDADRALHGTGRLGEDCLVARPAAAADGSTATMKETQGDVVAPKHLDQGELGPVQLPSRSQITAVLVAVRISKHDLLHVGAGGQQPAILRMGQELVHGIAAVLEISDRFE